MPTTTITIRVEEETRKLLQAAADAQGVTFSDYVRGALEASLRLEKAGGIGTREAATGDAEITLSPFERKVLQLLHRNLLATKGELSNEYFDADAEVRALKVLEHGFAGEYSEEFADISTPMSQAECSLVWDILDMFRVIENSVDQLGENGWDQLKVRRAQHYGTFRGFDHNDPVELRLAIYTKFLVNSGRWEEQQAVMNRDGGNTRMPMLPIYRAMLREFKPLWRQELRSGATMGRLNVDQVSQILAAAPGAEKLA